MEQSHEASSTPELSPPTVRRERFFMSLLRPDHKLGAGSTLSGGLILLSSLPDQQPAAAPAAPGACCERHASHCASATGRLSGSGCQVEEVRGQDVVCVAQNDALLEGLLTLIHKEREAEFHMSSVQVWRLALPQRLKVLFTRPARRSTALTLS